MAKKHDSKGTKEQLIRLFIGLGAVIVILLAYAMYLSFPLMYGKTIVLDTRPVDPFDIFRGQYLTINYEISTIPTIDGIGSGDTVYVVLNEDETGIWRYERASLSKPEADYFIKGKVEYDDGETMRVKYGIEQFFFERDAELNTGNLTVEAKVAGNGQSRINKLLSNGTELDIKYSQTPRFLR